MAKKEVKKELKTIVGVISSFSGTNTIKIRVDSKFPHPKYGKIVKSHRNFMVHNDSDIELNIGDTVEIKETKPISKTKKWILVNKIK